MLAMEFALNLMGMACSMGLVPQSHRMRPLLILASPQLTLFSILSAQTPFFTRIIDVVSPGA